MRARLPAADIVLMLVTVSLGLWYVANSLTPSSYAVVLRQLGVPQHEDGLLSGSPRPIRSDEWAHMTPWVQATVRNSLGRFNEYSPYHEDFRAAYGMPVADWGMVFKPSYWLFLVAPARYAYSFHFFSLAALFILGYTYLFVRLGIRSRAVAAAGATILLFSPFVQGWWTVNAAALSYVPWIALSALCIHNAVWRFLATTWLLASMSISAFYPPFLLCGGLFAAVVFCGYDDSPPRQRLVRVLIALCSVITAAGITYFYLFDEINAILNTVYPGRRLFRAAGMSLRQFVMQFYPTLYISRHDSLIGMNICEIGVVGSAFNVGALVCLDYKQLARILATEPRLRRFYGMLLLAFVYVAVWLLLPVPDWWGRVVGLNRVVPVRTGYLSGLLLFTLLLHAGYRCGFVSTPWRMLLLFVAMICPYVLERLLHLQIPVRDLLAGLIVVPALLLASLWYPPRLARPWSGVTSCVVACTVLALSATFGFNPLQSAAPIFSVPKTGTLTALDELLVQQGGNRLLVPRQWGFSGSVLTGLGYPSLNIATFRPVGAYWRGFFPEIANDEFNHIFNRTAHVALDFTIDRPSLASVGLVTVPLARVVANFDPETWRRGLVSVSRAVQVVTFVPATSKTARLGGYIESFQATAAGYLIRGWGPWRGIKPSQRLIIAIPPSVASPAEPNMQLYAVTRPDVAAAAKSQDFLETGFELLLADEAVAHLVRSGCLLAEDAPGVYFILRGSLEGTTNEDACRQAGWLIERGSFL